MSIEQNRINGKRLFEDIWNANNLAIAQEIIAPHYVLHAPSGTYTGVEGLQQYVSGVRSALPDLHITIEDHFAEGDKSVVRFTFHGTHQGTFQGIPPTGKPATIAALSIFHWANGMAEEAWTIYDQLNVWQQLGLASTSGSNPK